MRWTFAGLLLPVLLVAGCSLAGSSSGRPSEPADDGMILPSPSKGPGATGRPPQVVTGRLGFDAVEGGCAYLEQDDGKRYEVIYPEGWTVDHASASLTGPAGERIAAGDVVTVRGSVVTDRSSICQLGPIFGATAVLAHP